MTKLTLQIPNELVKAAETEAEARDISVSELVSDFFWHLALSGLDDQRDLAPHTRRLAGCIPTSEIKDYTNYLESKHS